MDAGLTHPEKLGLDAESISPPRFSTSSYDISSSSTIPSDLFTKEPRYGYRYCSGFWSYWKRLPTGLRFLVGLGLVAVTCVLVWFIEKDKLAKLEITKADVENAIHQRISALPDDSSKISWSTATDSHLYLQRSCVDYHFDQGPCCFPRPLYGLNETPKWHIKSCLGWIDVKGAAWDCVDFAVCVSCGNCDWLSYNVLLFSGPNAIVSCCSSSPSRPECNSIEFHSIQFNCFCYWDPFTSSYSFYCL